MYRDWGGEEGGGGGGGVITGNNATYVCGIVEVCITAIGVWGYGPQEK